MAMTDFQRMKVGKMFDVFDLDGDGMLQEADYTRRARSFAQERGWTEESPEYREQLDFTLSDWRTMQQAADGDGDGRVTRDEFVGFADRMLGDPAARERYADEDAALVFKAMDTDGDGRITAEEYQIYLRVYDLEPANADYFFERMDQDGDGFITRDEFLQAMKEFLFSEEFEAPGNFLFGPLDQRLDRVRS